MTTAMRIFLTFLGRIVTMIVIFIFLFPIPGIIAAMIADALGPRYGIPAFASLGLTVGGVAFWISFVVEKTTRLGEREGRGFAVLNPKPGTAEAPVAIAKEAQAEERVG